MSSVIGFAKAIINGANSFIPKIMATPEVLKRLEQRAQHAEDMIAFLQNQILEIRKLAVTRSLEEEEKRLRMENEELKNEVEVWRKKLIELEVSHGVQQIPIPGSCDRSNPVISNKEESVKIVTVNAKTENKAPVTNKKEDDSPVSIPGSVDVPLDASSSKEKVKAPKGNKKKAEGGEGKSKPAEAKAKPADDLPVDVGRLDFRIGRILNAKRHPDADALYVEEVDIGEGKNRTVVSGLVKHVPLEEMQNRLVMLLCNLKPAKMRGIVSEAMVMCASTPEKVEILEPPQSCVPGDLVSCEGYERQPDKELNPKKKIFEQVAPDLKTDESKRSTYKSVPLMVPGKGPILAKSLVNVQIK